jgi:hypothetical protein
MTKKEDRLCRTTRRYVRRRFKKTAENRNQKKDPRKKSTKINCAHRTKKTLPFVDRMCRRIPDTRRECENGGKWERNFRPMMMMLCDRFSSTRLKPTVWKRPDADIESTTTQDLKQPEDKAGRPVRMYIRKPEKERKQNDWYWPSEKIDENARWWKDDWWKANTPKAQSTAQQQRWPDQTRRKVRRLRSGCSVYLFLSLIFLLFRFRRRIRFFFHLPLILAP